MSIFILWDLVVQWNLPLHAEFTSTLNPKSIISSSNHNHFVILFDYYNLFYMSIIIELFLDL